jgi:hypothetical protein
LAVIKHIISVSHASAFGVRYRGIGFTLLLLDCCRHCFCGVVALGKPALQASLGEVILLDM